MLRHVVLLAAAIIAGCGGGGPAGGKVAVTFWHAMGGPLGDALDSLVVMFNERHPDVVVSSVNMGSYQALSQKLFASIEAGNPPALAQVYENWTANFIDAGALVPVEEYIRGENGLSDSAMADFFEPFLEGNTFGGRVWTFPFNKGMPAIYYNKDMFAAAGLDSSRAPRTWDELRDWCKRLTVRQDGKIVRYGMGYTVPTVLSMFEAILLQNGGRQVSPDCARATYNSPEGVAALQYLYDLMAKDSCAYLTAGSYEHQSEFAAGSSAMIHGHLSSLAYMEPQVTFHMGMGPLPAGGIRRVQITGTNFAIFSAAKKEERDAAWEFVKWMTEPDQTAFWSAKTGYVPVRRSAFENERLTARFAQVPGLRDAMMQVEYSVPQPQCPEWYEGRKYLEEDAIERVMRGLTSPREALDQAAGRLDEALSAR